MLNFKLDGDMILRSILIIQVYATFSISILEGLKNDCCVRHL